MYFVYTEGRVVAQATSCWLLTAQTRVHHQIFHVKFVVKKQHWGMIFFHVPPFPFSILFHQMLSVLFFIFRQRNTLWDI
jgi:hypothetical protein